MYFQFQIGILYVSLLWCGCVSNPRQTATSARLVPGDCVVIDAAHRTGREKRYEIDSAGDISMPFLGKVRLAGLTLAQAEERLEKAYVRRGFFRDVDLVVLRCP